MKKRNEDDGVEEKKEVEHYNFESGLGMKSKKYDKKMEQSYKEGDGDEIQDELGIPEVVVRIEYL